MGTQQPLANYNGHEITVTLSQSTLGSSQSKAEIDLGHAACIVFEHGDQTFSSAEEAHTAALALAQANLSLSRMASKKP